MLPFTLPDSPTFAVAFSGGADSRLLLELTLRALLERDGEAGRDALVAIHLHHGIRGAEADRDLDFCREVCEGLGVELIFDHADIPALSAETGESLETAARRARYELFSRIMNERKIPALLTAHHADDNLETVLAQLLRGSGTRGMGGIPPCRMLGTWVDPQVKFIFRPLLEWTKTDILDACDELELSYVTDSTNLEYDHTRNRIRHTVIPALEDISGRDAPQRAAARMSRAAREDEEFLWGLAEKRLERTACLRDDAMELSDAREQHPAIAKRMLMILYRNTLRYYRRETDAHPFLSFSQLEALLELAKKGIPESSLSLPCGMEARVRERFLYMIPADAPCASSPDRPILLEEGEYAWGESCTVVVERSAVHLKPDTRSTVYASAVFPPDLPLPLMARKREAGDTILSHGMNKKLKKLLNEKDIPAHLRDLIPLICLSDGEPLWYPRAAFRDGFPAPDEGPCVRITVHTIRHNDFIK